jgi:hypothetical protein
MELGLPGSMVVDYHHVQPKAGRGVCSMGGSGKAILLLSSSVLGRVRLGKPERCFFGKIGGEGGLVGVPYGQVDCSHLFDDVGVDVYQINLHGASAKYGTVFTPAEIKGIVDFRLNAKDVRFWTLFLRIGTNDIRNSFYRQRGVLDQEVAVDVDQLLDEIVAYGKKLGEMFSCRVVYLGGGYPGGGALISTKGRENVLLGRQFDLNEREACHKIDIALCRLFMAVGRMCRTGRFLGGPRVYGLNAGFPSTFLADSGTGHPGREDAYTMGVLTFNVVNVALAKLDISVTGLCGTSYFFSLFLNTYVFLE